MKRQLNRRPLRDHGWRALRNRIGTPADAEACWYGFKLGLHYAAIRQRAAEAQAARDKL